MRMNEKPLLKFMLERHAIWIRRQEHPVKDPAMFQGKPTWTKDKILQTYKFTNVYRELDRMTIWVRNSIREPFKDHPNLWFMLAMARQIGWPPTLRELMNSNDDPWPRKTWNWRLAMNVMRKRAARGEKVYTGAYMLNAHGEQRPEIQGHGTFDKPLFTCRLVLHDLWNERAAVEPVMHTSIQQVTERLQDYFGWGGFMSYEVACDLRYTRYLRDAPDKLTWAHAGPGARRGLRRVTGRYPGLRDSLPLMRELHARIAPAWPHLPALELREIEHSLCEFDKYERARLGEGRPRALFQPTTGDWDGAYH